LRFRSQKGRSVMPYVEDPETEQAMTRVIDLLCSMPAQERDRWAAWLVDEVADSKRLTEQQGGNFLIALYRHLLNRVTDVATGDIAD
jgi:hypothetical protein